MSIFIRHEHERVSDNGSGRASGETSPEAYISFGRVDRFGTVDDATIWHINASKFVFLKFYIFSNLESSFDDVLGIRKEPAEEPADTSRQKLVNWSELTLLNALNIGNEFLSCKVSSKLAGITWDFSDDS